MQDWLCSSKVTSKPIHSGIKSTILKFSSLFCKHQPLPPLHPPVPPAILHTSNTKKRHSAIYILLGFILCFVFVYCFPILCCCYFSLSLSPKELVNFQDINYHLQSHYLQPCAPFQAPIPNLQFSVYWTDRQCTGWWFSNIKPLKSSQSRANHFHVIFKKSKSKVIVIFLPHSTFPLLDFIL